MQDFRTLPVQTCVDLVPVCKVNYEVLMKSITVSLIRSQKIFNGIPNEEHLLVPVHLVESFLEYN